MPKCTHNLRVTMGDGAPACRYCGTILPRAPLPSAGTPERRVVLYKPQSVGKSTDLVLSALAVAEALPLMRRTHHLAGQVGASHALAASSTLFGKGRR